MTSTSTIATGEVLARVEANLATCRQADFERLELAREWALLHLVDPEAALDPRCRPTPLGASGLLVQEYAAAELAVCLQVHPLAARHLMADAVDLETRLPHAWQAVAAGRLETWVARKLVALTSELATDRARWVDAAVAELLGSLPTGRLLTVAQARVVEADQALAETKAVQAAARREVWLGRENDHGVRTLVARGDADQMRQLHATTDHLAHLLAEHGSRELAAESMDELRARAIGLLANPLAALKLLVGAGEHDPREVPDQVAEAIVDAGPSMTRPRAVVHLHLDPSALAGRGVARAEELGALTRGQLIDLLGHHHVTLRPVIDLNERVAADCYEVPAPIAARLHLARPADAFPYATSLSRAQDRDHTIPYDPHGPPGQTRLDNLGHLTRHHHRIKTHAPGWQVRQDRGRFTWRTPHGRIVITDHRGTHRPPASPGENRLHALLFAA